MDVVLSSSKTLFQHELKGVRSLIPAYMKSIANILALGKGKYLQVREIF
jgi:hypothetical protein